LKLWEMFPGTHGEIILKFHGSTYSVALCGND
jgi:hypothetical protein